jgi:Kinesin motor domain
MLRVLQKQPAHVTTHTHALPLAHCMLAVAQQVFDMLRDPARARPLAIHEDLANSNGNGNVNGNSHAGAGAANTYCAGLSEYAVHSAEEALALLAAGEENRAVRETHMNQASSRSHSIFQVRRFAGSQQ